MLMVSCRGWAGGLAAAACLASAALATDRAPTELSGRTGLMARLAAAPDWEMGDAVPGARGTGIVNRDPAPCSATAAQCQSLYTGTGALGFGSFSSDSVPGTFIAVDNFTAAASGSVSSICFWGRYQTGAAVPGEETETFTVTYYSDAAGLPASVKAGPFTLSNPDGPGGPLGNLRRGAGLNATVFGTNAFQWSATHAPVTVAAGECVWIEIKGNANSVANRWRWMVQNDNGASAPFGDFRVYQRPSENAASDYPDYVGADACFCVNINMGPNQCTLGPEDPNAHCSTATPVTIGAAPVSGFSFFGRQDVFTFCKDRTISGAGLWYSVVGDGTTLTAQTCFAGTALDTVINVYCGGCTTPNCVTSNDDGDNCNGAPGSFPSAASWVSRAGVTYHIVVFGFQGAIGNFQFNVISNGVVAADQPLCTPDRTPVNTAAATAAENDACGVDSNSDCFLPGVQTVNLNTVVRGLGNSENSNLLKDRDEFFINTTVTQSTWFDVEFNVEYPAVMFMDDLSAGCDPMGDGTGATLAADFAQYYTNPNRLQFEAPAGAQLMFFTLPLNFGGLPCALPNEHDYTFVVRQSIVGACCVPATACFVAPTEECTTQVGTWFGAGSSCAPTDPCTAPVQGACCRGTTCVLETSANCPAQPNQAYEGDNTVCNVAGNNTTPCCKADFNQSGSVTVQDIFDFLGAYFSANPLADINGGGTTVQDIFDFLAAYFTGCV